MVVVLGSGRCKLCLCSAVKRGQGRRDASDRGVVDCRGKGFGPWVGWREVRTPGRVETLPDVFGLVAQNGLRWVSSVLIT